MHSSVCMKTKRKLYSRKRDEIVDLEIVNERRWLAYAAQMPKCVPGDEKDTNN